MKTTAKVRKKKKLFSFLVRNDLEDTVGHLLFHPLEAVIPWQKHSPCLQALQLEGLPNDIVVDPADRAIPFELIGRIGIRDQANDIAFHCLANVLNRMESSVAAGLREIHELWMHNFSILGHGSAIEGDSATQADPVNM